jgi:hypothetical protein
MDNKPDKRAGTAHPHIHKLENILPPGGRKRRIVTMAQLERQAARRKWLMISAAVAAALVVGVLIGRFLLP